MLSLADVTHLLTHEFPCLSGRSFSLPLVRGTVAGRSVLDGRPVHVADAQAEVDEVPESSENARRMGFRTILSVPLMREGVAIGSIQIRRTEAQLFTERQVTLLQTFADQAVIAVENVRLFQELDARNVELTETLARETATGEVLRAISGAQTDAQPVFDIIAASALRLCGAGYGQVALYDGELLHMAAFHNVNPEGVEALRRRFPARADGGSAMGRVIQTRAVVQIPDVLEDPGYAFKRELGTMGFRSLLVVPMLRKGEPIGAIAVGRPERGLFTDKQTELLQTFAEQAVIAIENVRLFRELEARTRDLTRSVGELQALGEVSQAVSSTLDLETVLATIVSRAVELSGSYGGIVYEFDEAAQTFHARAAHQTTPEHLEALRAAPIRLGEGAVGRAGVIREPVQVDDIQGDQQLVAPQSRSLLAREGMGSLLSVSHGSDQPAKLIILKYTPAKMEGDSTELLSFVGKGVTFDSGGISLKPGENMELMKYDMTGGATVLGAMRAIAQLKPPIPILGVAPCTENLPSGKATKPGDVVKAMTGKTIEIINTDAEGRLILADAIAYAKKLGATKIIDMATLTGAVSIALGDVNAAVLGTDQELIDEIIAAGKEVGEKFWQLPLDKEYSKQIKSDIADIKNVGGRKAGTITAAAFLKEFADGVAWAHLDIAGTAWGDDAKPYRSKGPTGIAVRTLLRIVDRASNKSV